MPNASLLDDEHATFLAAALRLLTTHQFDVLTRWAGLGGWHRQTTAVIAGASPACRIPAEVGSPKWRLTPTEVELVLWDALDVLHQHGLRLPPPSSRLRQHRLGP